MQVTPKEKDDARKGRNPSELRGLCKSGGVNLATGILCRNPSELRGLCKWYYSGAQVWIGRNPSELRGLCKQKSRPKRGQTLS